MGAGGQNYDPYLAKQVLLTVDPPRRYSFYFKQICSIAICILNFAYMKVCVVEHICNLRRLREEDCNWFKDSLRCIVLGQLRIDGKNLFQ